MCEAGLLAGEKMTDVRICLFMAEQTDILKGAMEAGGLTDRVGKTLPVRRRSG